MARVLIKKLSLKVELPVYKTSGASGMDLMAFIDEPIKIPPNRLIFSAYRAFYGIFRGI